MYTLSLKSYRCLMSNCVWHTTQKNPLKPIQKNETKTMNPYHNSTKRSRTETSSMQPLTEKEMLENSSYIINSYVSMTNDELETWQQSVMHKCLNENKVNYLLDQLKSCMDPTDFNYPATRYYHSNAVMGRTRSLSFEDCAISMAIDNCGLQQTSGSDAMLDSLRNDNRTAVGSHSHTIASTTTAAPINHSNFMETAVAVAIQEKGLSPSNIQVSPNR